MNKLFVLLFISIPCLWSQDYSLKKYVLMPQAQIYMSDILECSDGAALPQSIASIPVQRMAGKGPYRIRANRVFQLLRKHGSYAEGDRIQGSSEVAWEQLTLSSVELVKAASAHVSEQFDEEQRKQLDITLIKEPSVLQINRDDQNPYQLIAEPLQQSLYGKVPYRVRVVRGKRELARCLLIIQVHIEQTVAVATRALNKGHVMTLGDVEMKTVLLKSPRDAQGLIPIDEIPGMIVRQPLSAHSQMRKHYLRQPFAVRGGEQVDMIYKRDSFVISVRGKAQGSAAIGDPVQVRGLDGGHLVSGVVIADGQVLIK